jgi:NAD(P)-dependent dehydrogenase (short-subunit alcohol dehydrogenase family)
MTLFDLSGKVAVITGSSKGIGQAIAERMAEHGAKVVISSRKADACETVAEGIRSRGGEAIVQGCHVGRKEELQGLVDATMAKWGRIDILVCNAAVNPHYGPSIGITDEVYDRVMNTNVRSNFWLCNMVLPGMALRKEGNVIVVSSIAGTDRLGLYGLSKAADMQLTRNIAVEWGPHNIRANCLAPGVIKTEFSRALWDNPNSVSLQAMKQAPLQRIGTTDEVAGAAVFLCSDAGAFITGQTLLIDGGRSIGRVSQDSLSTSQP